MDLHIGREIEKKFDESGLKPAEFAKRINTGPRNIYTIFKRKDMNSGQLKKISQALNFDFFSLYKEQLPARVQEPESVGWNRPKKGSVAVLVELDGVDETLTTWVHKLERINKAIAA